MSHYAIAAAAFAEVERETSSAMDALTAAQLSAVMQYGDVAALLHVARGHEDIIEPEEAIATLESTLSDYVATADLVVAKDGDVSAVTFLIADASSEGAGLDVENSADELRDAIAELSATTAEREATLESLQDRASRISAAETIVVDAAHGVVSAAATSGAAFVQPENASREAWAVYEAALAALTSASSGDAADFASLTSAYVDARAAFEPSYDDSAGAESVIAE